METINDTSYYYSLNLDFTSGTASYLIGTALIIFAIAKLIDVIKNYE